jgi:adenine-specific DNA-methyltransferase
MPLSHDSTHSQPTAPPFPAARAAIREAGVGGFDVLHPNTAEVHPDRSEGIASWLIDTNFNEESSFVYHADFLRTYDPCKSLKSTLKAEIIEEAWATLNSDTSRPFLEPTTGRIAVKSINNLGMRC